MPSAHQLDRPSKPFGVNHITQSQKEPMQSSCPTLQTRTLRGRGKGKPGQTGDPPSALAPCCLPESCDSPLRQKSTVQRRKPRLQERLYLPLRSQSREVADAKPGPLNAGLSVHCSSWPGRPGPGKGEPADTQATAVLTQLLAAQDLTSPSIGGTVGCFDWGLGVVGRGNVFGLEVFIAG